ncbi:uncharacterized protein IL334_004445 [Kwoniella shivajii]|uniref:Peroxisomal membrane protein PEX16 n=1 Tax=Kwoniella shivajii TaxID=564305 RepID=A0ABZ1D0I2_9TREE|nr:hypothetical protein IL334_004445 [Kwoniella shivajii]
MSIPPLSLDSSWRSDSHSPRRGKDRQVEEVIWDVQGLPNGLASNSGPSLFLSGSQNEKKKRDDEGLREQPMNVKVLARLMDTTKGRDKVLKCFQYSLKTYVYLLTLIARIRPLSPWFKSNSKRMKLAISGLSLTRKCLLLLNPLHPLSDLLSQEPMSPRTLVVHLIDLFSALSDDVYCLYKLGIVGRRTGLVADNWANRFWFLTTIMGLYKLHLKTIPKIANSPLSIEKRRSDLSEAKWTNRKLVADLAFVSYDVFELNFPILEEPMKCFTGLVSGLISACKLYNQNWEASIGKG